MLGKIIHSFSFGSKTIRGSRANRRGVVLIWAVLVMMLIIGFTGLTLDIGLGYLAGHQLQNAADAASLAAAQKLDEELADIQAAAQTIGEANFASAETVLLAENFNNIPDGDIVIGIYDRSDHTFTASLENPNAVKVVARRTAGSLGGPLPLVFGPIFGVNTINVERVAIAMTGGSTGAGLIVLNETGDATFRLSGDVTLDVTDSTDPADPKEGAIQVNSDSNKALKNDGQTTLIAGEINVKASESSLSDIDGVEVNTSQPRIDDPLAGLAPPDDRTVSPTAPTASDLPFTNDDVKNLQPGYYPDGISMTGGTVHLDPGVYVLDGAGLNVTGGNLTGDGVMLYVINTLDPKSAITLTGNATIALTPASLESVPYGGILIWQDVANTNDATILGGENFSGLEGTVYIPTAELETGGTSDSFDFSQLIVDSIWIHGSGTVSINYDGRFPAPGKNIFLVE